MYVPTAWTFVNSYLYVSDEELRVQQLAYYILEGTLQHVKLMNFFPSELAAAAVLLARHTCGYVPWNDELHIFSRYHKMRLLPVAESIYSQKWLASKHLISVEKKYASYAYGCVAGTSIRGHLK